MQSLPIISGDACRKALEKLGWTFRRQTGSHMILTKIDSLVTLSIPRRKELAAGTLRRLIRDAGLTVEEFNALL